MNTTKTNTIKGLKVSPYGYTKTDRLILKDSTKTKLACWQLINERTKVVYADIYSDGLAEMIADHDYKVMS